MTKEDVLETLKFDMELRGLSKHTQAEYYTKVKIYQDHFGKPATELGLVSYQGLAPDIPEMIKRPVDPLSLADYTAKVFKPPVMAVEADVAVVAHHEQFIGRYGDRSIIVVRFRHDIGFL